MPLLMLGLFLHSEQPQAAFGQPPAPADSRFHLAEEKVHCYRELRGSYAKFRRFREQPFGFGVSFHTCV